MGGRTTSEVQVAISLQREDADGCGTKESSMSKAGLDRKNFRSRLGSTGRPRVCQCRWPWRQLWTADARFRWVPWSTVCNDRSSLKNVLCWHPCIHPRKVRQGPYRAPMHQRVPKTRRRDRWASSQANPLRREHRGWPCGPPPSLPRSGPATGPVGRLANIAICGGKRRH